MATSNIKFYKTAFPSDTNVYVDDIESYLSSLSDYEILNFQYIKHDLNISIKIDQDQSDINDFDYNYCSIKNSDENNIFYYEVIKVDWKAGKTLIIDLAMDTVNSLGQGTTSEANPRNFTSRTFVNRQHKDRFVHSTNYTPVDISDPSTYFPVVYNRVDKEPENLSVHQLKSTETALRLPGVRDQDWYVIYDGGVTAGSPIETYICAGEKIKLNKSKYGGSHTFNKDAFGGDGSVGDRSFYFFEVDNDDGWSMTFTNPQAGTIQTSDYPGSINGFTMDDEVQRGYVTVSGVKYRDIILQAKNVGMYLDNGKIVVTIDWRDIYSDETVQTGEPNFKYKPSVIKCDSVTITKSLGYYKTNETSVTILSWARARIDGTFESLVTGTHPFFWMSSIKEVDRTKESLAKIVKLPYCPISYTVDDNDLFTFNWTLWDLGQTESGIPNILKYKEKYLPDFTREPIIRLGLDNICKSTLIVPTEASPHLWQQETKLENSQFVTHKWVYDNFAFQLKPEYINIPASYTGDCYADIDYKVSSALTSKFLFKFNMSDFCNYKMDQDYENYLIVSRNNEDIIYNNAYLQYINNGYNYDKKLQSMQAKHDAENFVFNSIGTLNNALSNPKTYTPAVASVAVSSELNMLSMVNNITYNEEVRQTQMSKKLAELEAQGANIAGADDLQLLDYYNKNRLTGIVYEPEEGHLQNIAEYFFNYGYNDSRYHVPNVDSRIWFNFIQCTPEINYEGTKKFKKAWLDDLKAKYSEGVTVFHKRTSGYDFDRTKENWEKWIIGE